MVMSQLMVSYVVTVKVIYHQLSKLDMHWYKVVLSLWKGTRRLEVLKIHFCPSVGLFLRSKLGKEWTSAFLNYCPRVKRVKSFVTLLQQTFTAALIYVSRRKVSFLSYIPLNISMAFTLSHLLKLSFGRIFYKIDIHIPNGVAPTFYLVHTLLVCLMCIVLLLFYYILSVF